MPLKGRAFIPGQRAKYNLTKAPRPTAISEQMMKEADEAKEKAQEAKGTMPDALAIGRDIQNTTPGDLGPLMRNCLYSGKVNLVLTRPSTTTILVSADYISVEGAGHSAVSVTASVTDDGVALANSTWYAVWLMCGVRGENLTAVFSTSFTAPVQAASTHLKRRVGAVLTDGSAHFHNFMHIGDWWYWDADTSLAPFKVFSSATMTRNAWTSFSCAGAMPPTSRLAKLTWWIYSADASPYVQFRAAGSGSVVLATTPDVTYWSGYSGGTGGIPGTGECPTNASQAIEYYTPHPSANTTDGSVFVLGYYDVV